WKANGPDSKTPNSSFLFERNDDKAYSATIRGLAYEYKIDPQNPWLYVEVCARNISGQTCSHKVASASAESVAANQPGGTPVAVGKRPGVDLTVQPEIDLPGMDYRSEPLRTSDPQVCRKLCDSEIKCVAWTFVKGGVQSDRPICWLKDN